MSAIITRIPRVGMTSFSFPTLLFWSSTLWLFKAICCNAGKVWTAAVAAAKSLSLKSPEVGNSANGNGVHTVNQSTSNVQTNNNVKRVQTKKRPLSPSHNHRNYALARNSTHTTILWSEECHVNTSKPDVHTSHTSKQLNLDCATYDSTRTLPLHCQTELTVLEQSQLENPKDVLTSYIKITLTLSENTHMYSRHDQLTMPAKQNSLPDDRR